MDLRKKLASLYVVGKEVTFTDADTGEEITVWIQKLSPVQKEAILRRANAKRQSILAIKKRPDSDESVKPFVDDVLNSYDDRDLMIEFLQAEELANTQQKKEAEIAAKSEWNDEGYLEGLQDAWEGELNLRDVWLKDQDDPEASRVKDELTRFADQVEEAMAPVRQRIHRDYDDYSDEELVKMLRDKAIEVQADLKWLELYRRGEIQHAVRDPEDHTKLVFESPDDLDVLQAQVLETLFETYKDISVDTNQGKD